MTPTEELAAAQTDEARAVLEKWPVEWTERPASEEPVKAHLVWVSSAEPDWQWMAYGEQGWPWAAGAVPEYPPLAPVVARALGLPIPAGWDAKIPDGVFV